jgi:transcriptional pleiotropic regulator of transition state genes
MKKTGIVRKLDELGRITLPKELRRTLDITDRDPLEIYVEEDRIILAKPSNEICKCGCSENLTTINGTVLCMSCLEKALNSLKK